MPSGIHPRERATAGAMTVRRTDRQMPLTLRDLGDKALEVGRVGAEQEMDVLVGNSRSYWAVMVCSDTEW
jgi:hypothetical protein